MSQYHEIPLCSSSDCVFDSHNQVFISPDGTSHYYKEFEMNALNTVWSLCLNKPYLNGGYENSSRVFGTKG